MRKLKQTRLHNPPIRGNCFPTVIACFLDLECAEDALQIQEHYDEDGWNIKLYDWLLEKGWEWSVGDGHLFNDEFYLVSGESPRNSKVTHVCIYQNGKLWHDPHPDSTGIMTENHFECLNKVSKVCFKCDTMQPLSEYYKHKQMGDGHLNKCKTCTKEDTKKQTEINTSTPEGLEKERKRHRDKYHRLEYKESQKEWDKDKPWKNTTTYKGLRKKHYRDLPREFELHHWNYNDDYLLDVFILNIKDHKNLHNSLFLNLEKRIFYLEDGTELDTKEKHLEYINKLGIQTN